jgi:hypothetical protein
MGDFENSWNCLAELPRSGINRGNYMFGLMAMNLLEFICRLCQADPSKKALLDFSKELNKIEHKYFTHLSNDPNANNLLGINRKGFTLPYLNPNNNDNLLLTAIYDLIRNGVAHQYDQPIVDLLLDGKKFYVIVIGPKFGRRIDGRRRNPHHLSCKLDPNGNIGMKVYPNFLLLDFKEAVEQSKILVKNLGISRFDRKYNTNAQTLESDLKAGGHRFT